MQTFLPYRSFARSAAVLDPARLGKQRVETLQVLRALELPDYGWQCHPVVTMWRGRVPALVAYGLACTRAWTAEGRADTTAEQIAEFAPEVVGLAQDDLAARGLLPRWLGRGDLHLSHRSALVRKDPAFYRSAFGDVPDDLPYVWPDGDPSPEDDPPDGVPVWVVRCEPEDRVSLAVEAPGGRRSPKWLRQVAAFDQEIRLGDLVAVPVDEGTRFRVGEVTGPALAGDGRLARDVAWRGHLQRSDTHRPARLQDPRACFRVTVRAAALRD